MQEEKFSIEDFRNIADILKQMLEAPTSGRIFKDSETISAFRMWFPKALQDYYEFTLTKSMMSYKLRYSEATTWSRDCVLDKAFAYLVALQGYFQQATNSLDEVGRLKLSTFEAHTPAETSALAPFLWLVRHTPSLLG